MDPITLPDPPLGDDRIELRPSAPEDVDQVVDILQDPEIPRWTRIPVPYGPEHFHDFRRMGQEGMQAGTDAPFLIHAREDDRVVGAVGLHVVDERDLVAEIGYWCRAADRGKGYITTAVRLVRDWAFATQAWDRIEVHVAVGNEPSMRVAERAGFEREAVLRSRLLLRGTRHDMVMYAQLRPSLR